jgi:gliding motility-associated-like protein
MAKYNGSNDGALTYFIPQITNPSTNFILDKTNWVPITGEYTAVGGEQFITIGNFNTDANTITKPAQGGTQQWAYYYIDDVFVIPAPALEANAGSYQQICPGKSVSIGTDSIINPPYTYYWEPSASLNDTTILNPIASPVQTTTYTLTINYGACITLSDTVTVGVITKAPINEENMVQQICSGKETDIGTSSIAGITYLWQPSIGLSDNTVSNPVANVVTTTTYILSMNYEGCISLSDTIKLIPMDCAQDVFVPNAFSPNGDLNNDVFFVHGTGINSIELIIFNRWGEKIFESTNIKNGWDGTFNGQVCNTGVFVYYLKATMNDGTVVSKDGHVTLLR